MRKRRWFSALIFVIPAVLAAATIAVADGGKTSFKADLSGYEETPSVSSTGTGSFEARLSGDEISYTLTYEGLEGATTNAAHIHLGQRGVSGGVIAFLCGGGGKPACPATAGTVTGTITAADVTGPAAQGIAPGEFDEVVRALRAGNVYANVHTNKHPGGEIRGQANDANQNSN